jgi:hypothetical protein
MSTLLKPSAAARIKAAFDTCELVAQTVRDRRVIRPKPQAQAAPTRGSIVYEHGTARVVEPV